MFESVLFKSVFRYYIVTIRQYQLEPTSQAYEQLGSVYTKFILNRYENLEAFCFDLNNVFATWFDTEALGHAIGLLRLIYASQSANTIVSKEHLVEKSAAALEKIVPENTSLEPSTTHDTPLELHP